jgi:hypothetical protein
MDTQTAATPLQTLEHVWRARFSPLPWDQCFIIDHSLPYEVADQVPELTIEEVNAALECWRSKMVEAVDAVAADCAAAAKKLRR